MKVALIGATGLVGQNMIDVLSNANFPVTDFIPVASPASYGKKILFRGKEYAVISHEDALAQKPQLAIFSAGGDVSRKWAPEYAAQHCVVIDNSSAWRTEPDVPLVVPEVNISSIKNNHTIIANPNCSTIQMVVAIAPIHRQYGIQRLVISTYQSVTGSGVKGMRQLKEEQEGLLASIPAYPHPIHENVIPHAGDFDMEGYTSEERKLEFETRKILDDNKIGITATVVRVPVLGGHSVAVNIQTGQAFQTEDIRYLLKACEGITVQDDPQNNQYPMPLFSQGLDQVFVGRIRRDFSMPNALNMWIVSDNLRKGAATNAVQIAMGMLKLNLLPKF